ncbi:hypothetical protein H8959_020110 [Pygathrix nigripes]
MENKRPSPLPMDPHLLGLVGSGFMTHCTETVYEFRNVSAGGITVVPLLLFLAAFQALKAIIAMDTAGMILGWKFFDHAAHLGGALFGIWYVTYGHELIWKNREPLVKIWHEIRTNGPKKGGGSK